MNRTEEETIVDSQNLYLNQENTIYITLIFECIPKLFTRVKEEHSIKLDS